MVKPKLPSELDGELGFDIEIDEDLIIFTHQADVVETVLFKEEALILAAFIGALADRLPEPQKAGRKKSGRPSPKKVGRTPEGKANAKD